MLKYFIPANWFFILMMMLMTCYFAYNFTNQRQQNAQRPTPALSLIQFISK